MLLVDTIPVRNILGEGVQWDVDTQSLWWTDIQARRIHRYHWTDRRLESFAMPERVGSFGLIKGSPWLIAAFESGFALVEPRLGKTRWLSKPDASISGVRFNDGRVDRQGRFWAGSMVETEPRSGRANLYCVESDGQTHRRESGVQISNGMCWSPDGKRFYFADSPLRIIYCYEFNPANGLISNRREFVRTPEGAHPDGATVDAEGFLWSAHWGAGEVVRYSPDGRIDLTLQIPVSQPTCVAFGGPDLDLLFVTSARDGLSDAELTRQPSAGDVFVYKMRCVGLAEHYFVLDAGKRRNVEGP